MLGHLDTVWELGTFEKMPIRVEADLAYGPGIFDMKAGIVIAATVLGALKEHGLHQNNITLLLNSDEEEGSDSSRSLIEREAEGASCALVFEPSGPGNGIKTKRRGVGQYEIMVLGKAAHAGVEPEKGVSAIEELAKQILEIQSWNHLRPGITVNAGVVHGGTRSNVIPAEANVTVDVRVDSPEDESWIEERFRQLKVQNPKATLKVEGGMNRPPLVRSEQVVALYQELAKIGAGFGYETKEFWTGGASDGNFTSAMGIPTLDGLGAEGDGAHALHEQIIVSSLAKRANLIYHFVQNRLKPA
jgi:glutamate carboxypeptidase